MQRAPQDYQMHACMQCNRIKGVYVYGPRANYCMSSSTSQQWFATLCVEPSQPWHAMQAIIGTRGFREPVGLSVMSLRGRGAGCSCCSTGRTPAGRRPAVEAGVETCSGVLWRWRCKPRHRQTDRRGRSFPPRRSATQRVCTHSGPLLSSAQGPHRCRCRHPCNTGMQLQPTPVWKRVQEWEMAVRCGRLHPPGPRAPPATRTRGWPPCSSDRPRTHTARPPPGTWGPWAAAARAWSSRPGRPSWRPGSTRGRAGQAACPCAARHGTAEHGSSRLMGFLITIIRGAFCA